MSSTEEPEERENDAFLHLPVIRQQPSVPERTRRAKVLLRGRPWPAYRPSMQNGEAFTMRGGMRFGHSPSWLGGLGTLT
jgi:hypothetical protein